MEFGHFQILKAFRPNPMRLCPKFKNGNIRDFAQILVQNFGRIIFLNYAFISAVNDYSGNFTWIFHRWKCVYCKIHICVVRISWFLLKSGCKIIGKVTCNSIIKSNIQISAKRFWPQNDISTKQSLAELSLSSFKRQNRNFNIFNQKSIFLPKLKI